MATEPLVKLHRYRGSTLLNGVGPLFADFDNDGWKICLFANGYKTDITNLDFITYGKTGFVHGYPEPTAKKD